MCELTVFTLYIHDIRLGRISLLSSLWSSVQTVLVTAYALCPSIMNLLGIILIYVSLLLKVLVGVACSFVQICFPLGIIMGRLT